MHALHAAVRREGDPEAAQHLFPEYADDGRFWCKPLAKRATPGAMPAESEPVGAER